MKKKNIIVVGYPKSGTNWMGGLIADPVEGTHLGNWGFSAKNDISQGYQGYSGFQIYKSHHPYDDIFDAQQQKNIHYYLSYPRSSRYQYFGSLLLSFS